MELLENLANMLGLAIDETFILLFVGIICLIGFTEILAIFVRKKNHETKDQDPYHRDNFYYQTPRETPNKTTQQVSPQQNAPQQQTANTPNAINSMSSAPNPTKILSHPMSPYGIHVSSMPQKESEYDISRLARAQMASFTPQKLMNIEENIIFYAIINIVGKTGFNVHPQVAFNAFVKYTNDDREKQYYRAGSALSVDFLLTTRKGHDKGSNFPAAVIEYHGGGHFDKNDQEKASVTQKNDEVKRYMCQAMGIPFIVIAESEIKQSNSRNIDSDLLRGLIVKKLRENGLNLI